MDLLEATRSYEAWLGRQTRLVAADLERKHAAMAGEPFTLFRATFYRFVHHWSEHGGALRDASKVLAVGDLHVENFGTWRDPEGRLVWGVNDFDEAHPLPFTFDLARLATSARLAIEQAQLSLKAARACDAIVAGYREGLAASGQAFVLAEHNTWLWQLAVDRLRNPRHFWQTQDDCCRRPQHKPSPKLERSVHRLLPRGVRDVEVLHRSAGKGSLGRQRYLFRGTWNGGFVAREAKALAPSACVWASGKASRTLHLRAILARAVRSPDPSLSLRGSWLVRRLAADCSKLDLAHLAGNRDEEKLLWAMGFETANVHLGTAGAREALLSQSRDLDPQMLRAVSADLARATDDDHRAFRKAQRR